jgi:putative two-component system protein, hydrogenase maturation factor HypX/HoxX
MGGLYGSEYWTYLLPRRVGPDVAQRLTSAPFTPVGTREAVALGLLDATYGATADDLVTAVCDLAEHVARDPRLDERLVEKRRMRARDEQIKPLRAYRNEELARSYRCFFGEDRSYHEARHRFVHKLGAPCALPAPSARPRLAAVRPAQAR